MPAGIGHPRVRQYLNIKNNRGPRPKGAVAIEGLWATRAALEASIDVEVVFVCDTRLRGDASSAVVEALAARGALVVPVVERALHRMVDREGPDGLAAIAYLPTTELDDLSADRYARLLVADSFELAGNLGTIIRCADGAGAGAVILTERQVRVTHPLVVKASMGTLFTMPVISASRDAVLSWLRDREIRVVAADPAAGVSFREARYGGRVAVVLGSERYGLAPFWRDAADLRVSIPMLGVADSLNVGHAAALLLYEVLGQQTGS